MPKEMLVSIIRNGQLLELAFILFAYFLYWAVFLKLGFYLAGVKIKLGSFLPWATFGVCYCLVGKQFLPGLFFMIGLIVVFVIFFCLCGKIHILKALWFALLIQFISGIGVITIGDPLYTYVHEIGIFLFESPWGVVVGTFIELLFPGIVLALLTTLKISLFTSKQSQVTPLEKWNILLFGLLFFIIYNTSIIVLESFKTGTDSALTMNLVFEWLAALGAVLTFFMTRGLMDKQREQEKLHYEKKQLEFQLEQSQRILETLASEQREYRNQLQVVNMMAALAMNEKIGDYIRYIANEMIETSMVNIENPILLSIIMSQKIKAREQGIKILVESNTPVNDFSIPLLQLGEILNLAMDIFVDNEMLSGSNSKEVIMQINEVDRSYHFTFCNSDEAIDNIKNHRIKFSPLNPAEMQPGRLEMLQELIVKSGGTFQCVMEREFVIHLQIQFRKASSPLEEM